MVGGSKRTDELVAWSALQTAMRQHDPACQGDRRFVDDGRGGFANRELRRLCESCAILEECQEYAAVVPPTTLVGFWAGKRRGVRSPHLGT